MMTSPTLRLGPLPPIRVSPSTLITVLLLAVLMYPALSRSGAAGTVVALLAVGIGAFTILSVLVHEAAHALTARAFGASIDHIALTLWGGHTQYRARSMSAVGSILVSLSGPAANGVIAALSAAAGDLAPAGSTAAVFFSVSAWLNLVLAVFNLLPGLPMDGGRALESLLGGVLRNPVLGTRITAWIGRAIAVGVVLFPLIRIVRSGGAGGFSLLSLVWAMLIAGMLWQGASRALEGARMDGRIRTLDAASLARPLRIVAPGTMLAELGTAGPLEQLVVLDPAGSRPGMLGRVYRVDPAAAASVPPAHRDRTPVHAVSGPIGEMGMLPASLQGDELIDAMLTHPMPIYLVLDAQGNPGGVILSADVNALLRGR